jgi:hypothetical protein
MPVIELTTVIGCPLMCNICPQDKLIKTYKDDNKHLKLSDLQIILPKIPKYVRIDFSGMSEPWANKDCTNMFAYVLESGYNVGIYTTLVGMNKLDTDRFIDLIYQYTPQINVLCIHLPDKHGNMRGWKYTEDYEYSLSRSLELKNFPFFQAMTMNKNSEIHDDIKKFNIKLVDWNINWLGHTRANSLTVTSKNNDIVYLHTDHENPVSCASTPFYDHNVLLPNGDVVLCCMDYSLKHIIGNLLIDEYESLYFSNELIKIMKENKKTTHSKCSICKSCDNAKVYTLNSNVWI